MITSRKQFKLYSHISIFKFSIAPKITAKLLKHELSLSDFIDETKAQTSLNPVDQQEVLETLHIYMNSLSAAKFKRELNLLITTVTQADLSEQNAINSLITFIQQNYADIGCSLIRNKHSHFFPQTNNFVPRGSCSIHSFSVRSYRSSESS